jgi:hypothetical protein
MRNDLSVILGPARPALRRAAVVRAPAVNEIAGHEPQSRGASDG